MHNLSFGYISHICLSYIHTIWVTQWTLGVSFIYQGLGVGWACPWQQSLGQHFGKKKRKEKMWGTQDSSLQSSQSLSRERKACGQHGRQSPKQEALDSVQHPPDWLEGRCDIRGRKLPVASSCSEALKGTRTSRHADTIAHVKGTPVGSPQPGDSAETERDKEATRSPAALQQSKHPEE